MLENQDSDLTPISRLGEFGFIEHMTQGFEAKSDQVLMAVGDDAAVYQISDSEVEVMTTDLLVEGIHFDLSYVPLQHLGWKSVAVNVSDVLAMHAKPFGITLSVGMSSRFTVEAMEAFYEGVRTACDHFNVTLLGGDTSSSRTGLIISVTAIGRTTKEKVTYRSGAKANDLVCVTGDLGAAYAGLQILEREKAVFMKNAEVQPDIEVWNYVVGRQIRPQPPIELLEAMEAAQVKPNSMIDLSDGLASDLRHICKASKVGAVVYEERIPVDYQTGLVAEEFDIHPMTYALNGGEDYELLFTVPLDQHDAVKAIPSVHIIGHVTDDEQVFLQDRSGNFHLMEAQGWNHFGKSDSEKE